MTAKEMFEELGYRYYKGNGIIRVDEVWKNSFGEIKSALVVEFDISEKWFRSKNLKFGRYIGVETYKAINKQIEELGWNNENN